MKLLISQWFLSADGGPCSMPTRFGRLVEYFWNTALSVPPPTSTEAVLEGRSLPADGNKGTFTEFPLNGQLLEKIIVAARPSLSFKPFTQISEYTAFSFVV